MNYRAACINESLEKNKYLIDVEIFLEEFNKLHGKNISALEDNQMVLSHEITNKIHSMIYEFNNSKISDEILDYLKGTPEQMQIKYCSESISSILQEYDTVPNLDSKMIHKK